MSEIEISFTKSQKEFLDLVHECDNPLFVGGPGCGKSYELGFIAVTFALHSPETAIYIYAPENHHIRTIEAPNVLYWLDTLKIKNKGYNKHENAIFTEDPRCGNFYFKNMETPANMVGYQSYVALIDELDTLDEKKAEEIYRAISMRNRQQPEGVDQQYKKYDPEKDRYFCRNKVISFTTPEGYRFCYKKWELGEDEDFQLVRGRTEDNPIFPKSYADNLRKQFPEHVADAYLTGHFVNMESLAVYYNYSPDTHNSLEEVRGTENLYIGCDFNVDNTSGTVYVRRDGGRTWHAVDEFVGMRDAATLAHTIKTRYPLNKITMYPDASGRARNNASSTNLTSIQELERAGFMIRANKKNFLVQDRINATNKAFADGKLFVNQMRCPTVSRCLVNQPYDNNGKPCKKTGYDHQNDATTYPIVYEMGAINNIYPINIKWTV